MNAFDPRHLKVSIPLAIGVATVVGLISFSPTGIDVPAGRVFAMGVVSLAVWFAIVITMAVAGVRHPNNSFASTSIAGTALAVVAGIILGASQDTVALMVFAGALYTSIAIFLTLGLAWLATGDNARNLPGQGA